MFYNAQSMKSLFLYIRRFVAGDIFKRKIYIQLYLIRESYFIHLNAAHPHG